jgi:hypothetical protein
MLPHSDLHYYYTIPLDEMSIRETLIFLLRKTLILGKEKDDLG